MKSDTSGTTVIFRRYRRCGGRMLDAHKYGLKAWPIRIRRNRRKSKK